MSSKAAISSRAEPPAPRSALARFVGILFSPRSTFVDIVRQPEWLYPALALSISSLAFTETMLAKIGMERMIRVSLEQSGQAARMSAEQMERAVEGGANMGAPLAHLGGLLGYPMTLLLIALLGLGVMNGLFGAAVNFRTVFSVVCYANLPGVLAALMGIVMIVSGDPERFNPQNPAPTNPGFFLDPQGVSKPLYVFASSIDGFSIWILVLLGIALSETSGGKVKALSKFLIYAGIWMVWVFGKVGLAALLG